MVTHDRAAERLIVYTALSKHDRVRLFLEIAETPNVTLDELVKKTKIDRELAYFHLGMLHAADLVRQDVRTFAYTLTELGEKYHRLLRRIHKIQRKMETERQ